MEASRDVSGRRSYDLALCLDYCASYVDPGDIIVECGRVFIVTLPGQA
jgi:hypothetical protein